MFTRDCSPLQARNTTTKEIVAIKKMGYSGKQSAEVSVCFQENPEIK